MDKVKVRKFFDILTILLIVSLIIVGFIVEKYIHKKTVQSQVTHFDKEFESDDIAYWDEVYFKESCEKYDSEFSELSRAGNAAMREQTLLIVGLCQNLERILPLTLERWTEIGARFKDCHFLVYENDSKDASRYMLEAWSKKSDKHHYISETEPILPKSRLPRMQIIRQKCHDYYMKTIKPVYRPDIVMLYDMDLIVGVHPQGLACAFGESNWDVVWANGFSYDLLNGFFPHVSRGSMSAKVMYDTLALEMPNGAKSCKYDEVWRWECVDALQLKNLPFTNNKFYLNSAFGGVGLYKIDAFEVGNYVDVPEKDECEHIIFHRNLRTAGFSNTYIHPLLLVVR